MNTPKTLHVAAVAWAMCLGCSGPEVPPFSEVETSLEVSVRDFWTGIHPEAITIRLLSYRPWWTPEEFVANELPSWNENFRVVRWPSTTAVEGTWTFTPDTNSGEMQFVPERVFQNGWYALQVRPDRLSVRRGFSVYDRPALVTREGWVTARFHVGSFPVVGINGGVAHTEEEGRIGGGDFSIGATEDVFAPSPQRVRDLVTITVEGRPLECTVVPEMVPSGGRLSLGFTCPDPGPGTVRVELSQLDWTTEDGTPVQYTGVDGSRIWETSTDGHFVNDFDGVIARATAESP